MQTSSFYLKVENTFPSLLTSKGEELNMLSKWIESRGPKGDLFFWHHLTSPPIKTGANQML